MNLTISLMNRSLISDLNHWRHFPFPRCPIAQHRDWFLVSPPKKNRLMIGFLFRPTAWNDRLFYADMRSMRIGSDNR